MSVIKTKGQNWAVQSKQDVIALYEGAEHNENLPGGEAQIGMEVEFNLYDTDTLAPLSEPQNEGFISAGEKEGVKINNEPSAATLEILTDPFTLKNAGGLVEQMNERFNALWQIGTQRNMVPSPFGYLPHISPAEHKLIHNDRYRAFWIPPRKDMQSAFESFVDPSIQISISYKDFDHLLQIIRLSVILEPFLLLTTEADAGFYEGQRVDGSPRTRILGRRGRNGGIPDFYYSAKSGEELIDAHIEYTMHNQHVFACFDDEGRLDKLPDGVWCSFAELEELGYGPGDLLNYRQAQSESWRRTTNIAEIRDEDGTLFAHRAEISSLFCTGLQHQRTSSATIGYLLLCCKNFCKNINRLAKDFGIDPDNLQGSRSLLEQNYEAAYNHNGRYHALPFGTKTLGEFAKAFADIIEGGLKTVELAEHSAPLLHILREGRPDWLVNRETFKTLEQQKAYMKALPELAREHPALINADQCADFTKDIVRDFLQKTSVQ